MPEVPGFAGTNQPAATVGAGTHNAALRDDRLPRTPLPPMLRVVVEEPLLRSTPRELMRIAAEPLVTRAGDKRSAAVVTCPRLESNH
jgi:hypothetical protein